MIRTVRLPCAKRVARDAVERVRQARELGSALDTEHALLVVWGLFAQQMGLLKGLEDVPVKMGTGVYTPQTKIIEFFIAVLAGLDSLHQLNEGERPLAEDVSLAVAWLREGLAHYSGVSRTWVADDQTVQATPSAGYSQPAIHPAGGGRIAPAAGATGAGCGFDGAASKQHQPDIPGQQVRLASRG